MNILFLCVANSARSQMAEGLAKSMLGNKHNIQSAGSIPSGKVHSHAIKTMDDIGIDIRDQYSKSVDDLDEDFLDNLDYAIKLCAEEVCPILQFSSEKLHWINIDPADKSFSDIELNSAFTKTRQDLYKLIKKFLIEKLNIINIK
jgi:arsenate reductase